MMDLIYITMGVLLPIIPAYLLYRVLPTQTEVSGPFKGFNIRLTGAFGGYFLLVLVILGFMHTSLKPLRTQYEIWNITGKIGFEQETEVPPIRSILLFVRPPDPELHEDGSFTISVMAKPGEAGGREFPTLILDHQGYKTTVVHLSEKERPFVKNYPKEYDTAAKQIVLKDPIILERKEHYSPIAQDFDRAIN
jgi:hypothetical protein